MTIFIVVYRMHVITEVLVIRGNDCCPHWCPRTTRSGVITQLNLLECHATSPPTHTLKPSCFLAVLIHHLSLLVFVLVLVVVVLLVVLVLYIIITFIRK